MVALGNGPLTAPQIAEKLALPLDETEATPPECVHPQHCEL